MNTTLTSLQQAEAYDRLLRNLEKDDLAQLLLFTMRAISEEPPNFAQWLMGLEYALWGEVLSGTRDGLVLKELAVRADCWYYWDEGTETETRVTLAEWVPMYRKWTA
jgi:hypothetical protein